MFDRFTDCAREIMRIARETAENEKQETVSTFLILAAMVQEGEGGAIRILKSLGVEIQQLHGIIRNTIKNASQTLMPTGTPPLSEKTRHALEFALREADGLGHHDIGSEHLLLGILDDHSAPPSKLLAKFGVGIDAVRTAARQLHEGGLTPPAATPAEESSSPGPETTPPPESKMYDRHDLEGALVAETELPPTPAPKPDPQPRKVPHPEDQAEEKSLNVSRMLGRERRIAELDKQIWTAVAARDFRRAAGLEDVRRSLVAERKTDLGID